MCCLSHDICKWLDILVLWGKVKNIGPVSCIFTVLVSRGNLKRTHALLAKSRERISRFCGLVAYNDTKSDRWGDCVTPHSASNIFSVNLNTKTAISPSTGHTGVAKLNLGHFIEGLSEYNVHRGRMEWEKREEPEWDCPSGNAVLYDLRNIMQFASGYYYKLWTERRLLQNAAAISTKRMALFYKKMLRCL